MKPTDHQALSADVLAVVFHQVGIIHPRTLLFAVPRIYRTWRDVCQSHVLGVDINLKMAGETRPKDVSLFVAAVNAIVRRFHSAWAVALDVHRSITATVFAAVAQT
jgi:hypothetical protein